MKKNLSPAWPCSAQLRLSLLWLACLAWLARATARARAQPFWARLDWAKPVLGISGQLWLGLVRTEIDLSPQCILEASSNFQCHREASI